MRRVSKQQFIRYTSKYLKDLPIIVTHRGIDNLLVKDFEDEDRRIPEKTVHEVPVNPKDAGDIW